ncbi:hypothetical protein [Miltoncostaea oceani]|uniref:hypothetical protein n=1 Tax=Miltoncostaea oceani TaxID=2843216 RepID=UPI001C3D369A|nr:hypothetical protein [Miltoncostaea oceani]
MRPLRALGLCALAGAVGLATASTATARVSILDDDPEAIARAVQPQPDGSPGLGAADGILQVNTKPPVLGARQRVVRLPADDLVGRTPSRMAAYIRAAIKGAGSQRTIIDELGPAFRGRNGDNLAAALAILADEATSDAIEESRARRVHVYVPAAGDLLTGADWAGARLAMARAGGVWLRTSPSSGAWTGAQWQTWPAEMARLLAATGSSGSRVHVVLAGDQAAAWRAARTGAACPVLGNGPGAQRLGAAMTAFVAEFRRAMPAPGADGPAACLTGPVVPDAGAAALEAAATRPGLEIAPLGIPPLVAGEPAQLTVQVGSDPFGLAAASGLAPEDVWGSKAAYVRLTAPGTVTAASVDGDGAARFSFVPSAPGPVTAVLVLTAPIADRMARARTGVSADLLGPLRRVGATVLPPRAVAAPGAWSVTVPIAPAGGAPGDPLAQVIAPPS